MNQVSDIERKLIAVPQRTVQISNSTLNMAENGYHILCVGDSRLSHLQLLLNDNCRNIKFAVLFFPEPPWVDLLMSCAKLCFLLVKAITNIY